MKIRTKIRTRINAENLFFLLALFCVSSYAFLEQTSVSVPLFSYVKFPLLGFGGLCMLGKVNLFLKNILKKKYFYVLSILLLFFALFFLSSFFNRDPYVGESPLYDTLRLILFLAELFLLMVWAVEAEHTETALQFCFVYVFALALVTDLLFFSGLVVFRSGRHELYLVGTKFDVSYMHMNLLTLWYLRSNARAHRLTKKKGSIALALFFVLAVSIRVNCMTGAIGCVVLFVFFMLLDTRIQRQFVRFTAPSFMVLFLLVSILFPFFSERLVSIPFVRYLIEELLGRDSTITGRLTIFGEFLEKTWGHLLWGFGYGNGYKVSEVIFHVANAQNALLHWILQVGIIPTLTMCGLIVYIIRQLSRSPRRTEAMPLLVLVYVYVVLGTVEITFNMNFFLWVAILFMYSAAKNPGIKA